MQKLKLPSDKNKPNSIKNIKIDIKKELNNITNKSSKCKKNMYYLNHYLILKIIKNYFFISFLFKT